MVTIIIIMIFSSPSKKVVSARLVVEWQTECAIAVCSEEISLDGSSFICSWDTIPRGNLNPKPLIAPWVTERTTTMTTISAT